MEAKSTIQSKHKSHTPWMLIVCSLCTALSLLASLWLLTVIPTKAKSVQKLRTQGLAYQISDQDTILLTQSLKDSQGDRDKLIAAFPTESTLLQFMQIIDTIKASQVQVLRFSVDSDQPTKIGRNPSFLPVSLNIKGPQARVVQALQAISQSPYFIKPVVFFQDYEPGSDTVIVTTQFHLFVSDAFAKTNR